MRLGKCVAPVGLHSSGQPPRASPASLFHLLVAKHHPGVKTTSPLAGVLSRCPSVSSRARLRGSEERTGRGLPASPWTLCSPGLSLPVWAPNAEAPARPTVPPPFLGRSCISTPESQVGGSGVWHQPLGLCHLSSAPVHLLRPSQLRAFWSPQSGGSSMGAKRREEAGLFPPGE